MNNDKTFLVVPRCKRAIVDQAVKKAREEPRNRLEYACLRATDALKSEAVATPLMEGKSYCYIGYSPMATASRDGRMIPYHGEIYLYRGVFHSDGDKHWLSATNAWGVEQRKHVAPDMLLIEH